MVAAGPGRVHPETGYQLDCAVSPGDSVIYGKYDGTEMKYNDDNHQLIKDDDVLLKYKGNDLTLDNCEPVKDQVMIKLQSRETTNAAGIIVNAVDNKETRIDCGIVTKVGPGRQAGNGITMPLQVWTSGYFSSISLYVLQFFSLTTFKRWEDRREGLILS